MEVFKCDRQVGRDHLRHLIAERHLKCDLGPPQAAGILQHPFERFLQVRLQGSRQWQMIREGPNQASSLQIFHRLPLRLVPEPLP
jgi:hypothetical protein